MTTDAKKRTGTEITYEYLLNRSELALEIAQNPTERKHLSSKDWRNLIQQNNALAGYALTERSWGIAESFSREGIITLVHGNAELTSSAFQRFQLDPVKPTGCFSTCFSFFSSNKLNTADWSKVAMHANEAAAGILDKIGGKFNADQLFDIAVSNPTVQQTVVSTFSEKLTKTHQEELAPKLQADALKAKSTAASALT